LLGNQTWGACGVGGGATPGGLDTQVQFNDGGSALGGNSFLTFNKTTHNLTLPDASVWGPAGITAPTSQLIALDGSFTNSHFTGFLVPSSGSLILQAGSIGPPILGGRLNLNGPSSPNAANAFDAVGYGGGGNTEFTLFPAGAVGGDGTGYTFTSGMEWFRSDNGFLFALDRANKSAHFYGALNFPNGAGTGNSFGVIGAVPVSGGSSTPTKWSSDLSGTYVHTGANGTLSSRALERQ
jgi:hypothetical protein